MANNLIDELLEKAVFDNDVQVKLTNRHKIRDMAAAQGITLSSMQGLYEAAGKGLYSQKTVPAINVRGKGLAGRGSGRGTAGCA